MTDYKKVILRQFPTKNPDVNPESRYWKQGFDKPVSSSHFGKISTIEFCPVAPFDFAICASTRVKLFDASVNEKRTITRFKDVVHSASFRGDGKLLVTGGEDKCIQVFDLGSRVILRMLKGHTAGVHVAKFATDTTHIFSASDDHTSRRWDVPTGKEIGILKGDSEGGHTDYIRCAVEPSFSPQSWITGSYDTTVKLWDWRSSTPLVRTMAHQEQVESVITIAPGLVLAAGGPWISVWDVTSGRQVERFSNHQKPITCLAHDPVSQRLLSGSLDHSVKVYSLDAGFAVTHSFHFPQPVLSMALGAAGSVLCVGMVDGTLNTRTKIHKEDQVKAPAPAPRGGTKRFLNRGHTHTPTTSSGDVIASATTTLGGSQIGKKLRLKSYDKDLRNFNYSKALDSALETKRANVVVSVLEELVDRGALTRAIQQRDHNSLEAILSFVVKQIDNPAYETLLIDVANIILDCYGSVLGQSPLIDEMFLKLKRKIQDESKFQQECAMLVGTLEMVLANHLGPADSTQLTTQMNGDPDD